MTTEIEMQEAADAIDVLIAMIEDVRDQTTDIKNAGIVDLDKFVAAVPSDGLLAGAIRDLRKLADRLRPPEADKLTPLETDR